MQENYIINRNAIFGKAQSCVIAWFVKLRLFGEAYQCSCSLIIHLEKLLITRSFHKENKEFYKEKKKEKQKTTFCSQIGLAKNSFENAMKFIAFETYKYLLDNIMLESAQFHSYFKASTNYIMG